MNLIMENNDTWKLALLCLLVVELLEKELLSNKKWHKKGMEYYRIDMEGG